MGFGGRDPCTLPRPQWFLREQSHLPEKYFVPVRHNASTVVMLVLQEESILLVLLGQPLRTVDKQNVLIHIHEWLSFLFFFFIQDKKIFKNEFFFQTKPKKKNKNEQ
jgi:hypothetical protein